MVIKNMFSIGKEKILPGKLRKGFNRRKKYEDLFFVYDPSSRRPVERSLRA
jgi:hypothetical protein